jgi:hypothetical protein
MFKQKPCHRRNDTRKYWYKCSIRENTNEIKIKIEILNDGDTLCKGNFH